MAAYRIDRIQAFADRLAKDTGVNLTLTDQGGVQLTVREGRASGLASRRGDQRVAVALRGRPGVREIRGERRSVLSACAPLRGVGWTVIAETPTEKAFAGVHKLRSAVLPISQRQRARDEALHASFE